MIVPTFNPGPRFVEALAALVPGAVQELVREVIVADGGSTDGAQMQAEEAGCRVLSTSPGRGVQLRAACAEAKGDWLLVLHADTVVQPGWIEAVSRHIERFPDKAAYFRLRFDDDGVFARLWEAGAGLRGRLLGLPYGDQGLLVPRALYDQADGYPDWPLMEDVELAWRIGRSRLRRLDATALTDASKYRRDGWLARGFRNLMLLTAWGMGTDPRRLSRLYD